MHGPQVSAEERRAKLAAELERLLGLLRARDDVRKVVVFGSFATRQVRAGSDLDLQIVLDTEQRFTDRLDGLYRYLCPRVAVDLLALTPAEVEQLADESAWMRRVLAEGEVLHAA